MGTGHAIARPHEFPSDEQMERAIVRVRELYAGTGFQLRHVRPQHGGGLRLNDLITPPNSLYSTAQTQS